MKIYFYVYKERERKYGYVIYDLLCPPFYSMYLYVVK